VRPLRATWIRFRNLFRTRELNHELEEELRAHMDLDIADNLRVGMSPAEARRQALLKLGGLEQTKAHYRAAAGFPLLESIGQDLRFAFRSLGKSPGFTAVAVLTLALGIGATTVMFSVVYHVFFDALPYKDYQRYVVFGFQNSADVGGWKGRDFFGSDEVRSFRKQNQVFEDVIVHNGRHVVYNDGKFARHWPKGEDITPNAFEFLGVRPHLGRTLAASDVRPDSPPVFVMNYRLWQKEFAGNPGVLNTAFVLDRQPRTLVGIMPERFNLFGASFWFPMNDDQAAGSMVARLKPGIDLATAAADLDVIARQLQKTAPAGWIPSGYRVIVRPLLDSFIGGFRKTLYALFGAVLLLLLIACINVASLLLVRATVREREMVMRAALGASRSRLIRQLLAESLLLASFASITGCFFAFFALKAVVASIPAGALPEEVVIRLDHPVLFAVLCLSMLTTVACGLAPALQVISSNLQSKLTSAAPNLAAGSRHGKIRGVLVIGEVALSIILLIGGGLLMRSFFLLTHVDLGFAPENIVYFRLALPEAYNTNIDTTRERKNELTRRLLDRLQSLPGVTAVSESMLEPPIAYDWSDTIIPGKPHTERWETHFEVCSEGYFAMLGLPLLNGRLFGIDDVESRRYVMVVNQSFARQFFPGSDPIGHKVKLEVLDRPFLDAPHDTYFEIVGLVGNHKTRDDQSRTWRSFPEVYVPYSVQGFSYRTYMVKTALQPEILLKTVEQQVRSIDPEVEIATSGTLAGALDEFYRRPQFELLIVGAFAITGLLLVLSGIFGVMAYHVSRQTREIGIRLALGAQPREILCMMFATGMKLIAPGVAAGVLVSYLLSRYLASEVSGISPSDALTYGLASVAALLAGLLASYIPARRATRVNPMTVLRCE
jgi:putative ABC transport system permease protein